MTREERQAMRRHLERWWQTYVHDPGTFRVYTLPDAEEAYRELLAIAQTEGRDGCDILDRI